MSTFLYFAYGSNMLTARLKARCPSAEALGAGWVRGRVLRWHKVSADGSGKCDLAIGVDGDVAYGVVFEIAESERATLDEAEGRGHGYDHAMVEVTSDSASVTCLTYAASEINDRLRPYDWYRNLAFAGALQHGLPESYVAEIAAVAVARDVDAERKSRRQAERLVGEFLRQHPEFRNRLTGVRDG